MRDELDELRHAQQQERLLRAESAAARRGEGGGGPAVAALEESSARQQGMLSAQEARLGAAEVAVTRQAAELATIKDVAARHAESQRAATAAQAARTAEEVTPLREALMTARELAEQRHAHQARQEATLRHAVEEGREGHGRLAATCEGLAERLRDVEAERRAEAERIRSLEAGGKAGRWAAQEQRAEQAAVGQHDAEAQEVAQQATLRLVRESEQKLGRLQARLAAAEEATRNGLAEMRAREEAAAEVAAAARAEEAAARRVLLEGVEKGRHEAVEAARHGQGRLEEQVSTARRELDEAAREQREQLRALLRGEHAALCAEQSKLRDELRWLDEEHVRCRGEDGTRVTRALDALRAPLDAQMGEFGVRLAKGEERIESFQAAFVRAEGGGAEGGAETVQAFGAATLRVAALGEAVERLSGHLDAARPNDVSALVEERMAATVRKVQHQCESVFGAQGELLQRLSALEATVVQEQRASLSALEAMIKSPTITRRRSPTTTKRP